MPTYFISYIGGDMPPTPEEGHRHMEQFGEWINLLGDSIISPANPLKNTTTINADGSVTDNSASTMSGFTIIEAASMEAALDLAKQCPHLELDGKLEVSELVQMPI